MEKWEIDINCDVGEGLGNEAKLFPYISSCNLACGAHAGNDETMLDVITLAL
ncbi:MAG: LamB/YcsF family protein, partial [Muriicola sp.]|nr:LamB/YcsF family protein [Muriicola sp.]NNK35856.1 lactam utilization protein LamB [Eudoraea sp.]